MSDVITINPEWEKAPYEEGFLFPDGKKMTNAPQGRRFANIDDALAIRNPVPQYILNGVPTIWTTS